MKPLNRLAYRHWLILIYLPIFALSWIGADHYRDMVMEHTPTVVALIGLILIDRRRPLSNLTWTLIFIYLLFHTLGAHYTYSKVPYDAWAERWLGRSISDIFGWRRNHYDRLVHLLFGVLMVLPMRELVARFMELSFGRSLIVAITFIITISTLYEQVEWMIALLMKPEEAELYNGQQGDMFDAHKDTLLASSGAVFIALGAWIIQRVRAARR